MENCFLKTIPENWLNEAGEKEGGYHLKDKNSYIPQEKVISPVIPASFSEARNIVHTVT